MRASPGFVRLYISGLSWDASNCGASLLDTLKDAGQAQLKETVRGKVLIRARANGTEAFYSLPPATGMTAQDVAEVAIYALELYYAAATALGAVDDSALLAWMLAQCQTVRSFATDHSFSGIRL